jgi:rhodanese-related sulfurtransferase
LPALPILLLAGAAAADDGVFAVKALLAATAASMLADFLWFYAGRRFGRRWLELRLRARVPKLRPDELAEMIEAGVDLLVLDVRAGGAGLPLRERIPGSRHIDLAAIETSAAAEWPQDVPIVTYCDCPNDASATRAAALLAKRGLGVHVLSGGLDGWLEAGYALEAV